MEVHFYSGPGLKLVGFLEIPPDYRQGEKRPGIVICRGPGNIKGKLAPEVCSRLAGAGYVALHFYYRGFFDSEGPERRLIPLEQVEDIRNAMTFLQNRDEIDRERIGLWGSATGGSLVSYTAGIDTRVKCMVALHATGDMGRWLRGMRRYWEWQEFLQMIDEDRVNRVLTGESRRVDFSEVLLPDPKTQKAPQEKADKTDYPVESAEAMVGFQAESVVDRISPRAAMWICLEGDRLVPNEEAWSLYHKAGEPKKLVAIKAEDQHYALYEGPGFEEMMVNSIDWYDTYLKTR